MKDRMTSAANDRIIRWSMLIVGVQSGKGSIVENKWIKHITSVYHFLTCCVLLANVVVEVSVKGSRIFSMGNITMTLIYINYLVFIVQVTCCSWISFYLCHRDSGYLEYYTQLQKIVESNKEMQLKLKSLKVRAMTYGVVIAAWMLALTLIIIYTVNIVTHAISDPNGLENIKRPAEILLTVAYLIQALHWSMQTAHVATISITLWQIGEAFNNNFKKECESSASLVLQNLINYRVMHLSWCRLVSTANKRLRWTIAVLLTGSCAMGLISLYIIANTDWSLYGLVFLSQILSFVVPVFGVMIIIIILAEQVITTVSLQTLPCYYCSS